MGSKRDIVGYVSWVPKDIVGCVYHGFQRDSVGYVSWIPKERLSGT
jgi:hypothetical protein